METFRDEDSPVWIDLERAILELAVAVDLLSNTVRTRMPDNVGGAYLLVRASKAKLAGAMAAFEDHRVTIVSDALLRAANREDFAPILT